MLAENGFKKTFEAVEATVAAAVIGDYWLAGKNGLNFQKRRKRRGGSYRRPWN